METMKHFSLLDEFLVLLRIQSGLVIFQLVLFFLDIDECSASPSVCDINAKCSNTRGSYYCTCKPGFTGDGKYCQGWGKYFS